MKTKRPAVRIGDSVTISAIKSSIPAYDGKPAVLRDTVLRVSHITGTGSKRSPYHVVVTDGAHFWHMEPDDVRPATCDEPREVSDLAKACREYGSTMSAEERAGFRAYADAAPPRGSTLATLRSERAAETYKARTDEIRATMDRSTREFADAMSAASAEYEAAMVTDIGRRAATKLGAR